jgi:hypothetical protein
MFAFGNSTQQKANDATNAPNGTLALFSNPAPKQHTSNPQQSLMFSGQKSTTPLANSTNDFGQNSSFFTQQSSIFSGKTSPV